MSNAIANWYSQNKQEARLFVYALVTLVPAAFVADMAARAFVESGFELMLYDLLSLAGLGITSLAAFTFGVSVGLLGLLYVDYKKRAQSLILSIATVIGLVVLTLQGRFLPALAPIDFGFIPLGMLVGILYAGGGQLRHVELNDAQDLVQGRILTSTSREPLEFRRAERLLFKLFAGFTLVALVEAHVSYDPFFSIGNGAPSVDLGAVESIEFVGEKITRDLVASGWFLIALSLYLGYETQRRIFILGPPGSGKTHLPVGMFLAASNSQMHAWNKEYGLTRLINYMKEHRDFAERNQPGEEGDIADMGFKVATTGYFPKNVTVDALDYPGEYLPHIPDGVRFRRNQLDATEYKEQIKQQIESEEATKDGGGRSRGPEVADGGAGVALDDDPMEGAANEEPMEGIVNERPMDGIANEEPMDGTTDGEPVDGIAEEEPTTDSLVDLDTQADLRFTHLTEYILPRIERADLLLLVVDMERFENEDRLYTTYYDRLMTELNAADDAEFQSFFSGETDFGPYKSEKVVATKSDYALRSSDEYESAAEIMNKYDSFRKSIHTRVSDDMEAGPLLGAIGDAPYPVFLKAEDEDTSTLEFGPDGLPVLFGFRELIERIAE